MKTTHVKWKRSWALAGALALLMVLAAAIGCRPKAPPDVPHRLPPPPPLQRAP